ncbi:tetratricopeptide repeat protein [Pleionea sp. CnH1-48]|uniref:tetratricopeptide repeat protein n=1 Tax=Pleionea sp. CnH1-48 TaxID=2954494 RepID=UPI00209763D4|nr:tetratricopeptide repeat protein [Pleionea sp. CnH1-48]MCO7226764.1 tetratricopeptide repeat protein [Pleionea sp. CnH1-48]
MENSNSNGTSSPSLKTKTRTRGVRASRHKLEKALRAAGLKTQAALAEAIADHEHLDAPPKDLVNRVFREIPVAPQTIERVASVLNVESYTLYLSAEEEQRSHSIPTNELTKHQHSTNHQRITPTHIKGLLLILVPALIMALVLGIWPEENEPTLTDIPPAEREDISIPDPKPNHKTLSVALVLQDVASGPALAKKLKEVLSTEVTLADSSINQLVPERAPWELPKLLGVDYVITAKTLSKGRYKAYLFYLISPQEQIVIYSNVWLDSPLQDHSQSISDAIYSNLKKILTHQDLNRALTDIELKQTIAEQPIEDYLQGMVFVDRALVAENVSQAQAHFYRALRLAPNFLKARAALCESLVRLSIAHSDKTLLKDAQLECQSIAQQADNLPEYHFANGQWQRKSGLLDEAKQSYQQALDILPGYVDAQLGLAELYALRGAQQKKTELFEKALEYTQQAGASEPSFWKVPFIQARIYFISGQAEKGIKAAEKSVVLSENYNSLSNLGVMHFCKGNLTDARRYYKRVYEIGQATPVLEYQLGALLLFEGKHQEAINLMENNLQFIQKDSDDGHYEFWIGLAEAYRIGQRKQQALDTYKAALAKIENERLKGGNPITLKSYLIYIELMMKHLQGKVLEHKERRFYLQEIENLGPDLVEPPAYVRVLLSLTHLDEYEKAYPYYQKLSAMCKGYVAYPSLKRFADISSQ